MSAIYEPCARTMAEQKPIHYSLAQHVKDLFQNMLEASKAKLLVIFIIHF